MKQASVVFLGAENIGNIERYYIIIVYIWSTSRFDAVCMRDHWP